MYRPKRYTESELKKAGVTIIDKSSGILECDCCRLRWAVNLLECGRLPRGYWKCPSHNGCNCKE